MFYAKQHDTYTIKLVGDIRHTIGCALDNFLNQLFALKDYDNICIDLSEATTIDSTNLGLLAKVANFMRDRFDRRATLICDNSDIHQMLDSVGFSDIFIISQDRPSDAQAIHRLPVFEPTKPELTKTLYETHSTLSALNDENRKTFHEIVETLRGRLAKQNK
ncbi:MAG: STAS domain-containing protein [Candidatus Competibacteraceae bacterium]